MAACFLSFSLLFLLWCQSVSVSASPSKLDEVCNNIGGWYVTPEKCHSVLDTDPQSRTADLNGIGTIAANIAAKNAALVLTDMKQFFKATTDPVQQKALQTCVQEYTDVIPKLNSASELIKNKKYSEAYSVLDAALAVPVKCDSATADYPATRALVDKDDVSFSNVAYIARAVAGYLAN
jgi:pectinesterase inhibitor-like protein